MPDAMDDELIGRVASGDAAAFAELFTRQQALVYRFALHMTGSPAAADDVTQDVFMVVMRDAGRYEAGRSSVPAWLCGIARNVARRRFRWDRAGVPLDEQDGQDIPDADPGALERLTRAEGIEALRKAVLSLPVGYREAVVLCDLQELAYADAAAALGCAVGTVRSRLHRGRALLARKLSEGAGGQIAWLASGRPSADPDGKVEQPWRLRVVGEEGI